MLARPCFDALGSARVELAGVLPAAASEAMLQAHLAVHGPAKERLETGGDAWNALVARYGAEGVERESFQLLQALLGSVDGRRFPEGSPKESRRRLLQVSAWLERVNSAEVADALRGEDCVLKQALLHLSARSTRAASRCLAPGYPRLAWLCAALGGHVGGSMRRQLLSRELSGWPSKPCMPKGVADVLEVLAGEVSGPAARCQWRGAFGLFLWYGAKEVGEDALKEAVERFCAWYEQRARPRSLQLALLKLAAFGWEDYGQAVEWRTYSNSALDVAVAWHVCDLLGGSDRLTVQYAEQLEMQGLWHWAVYVAGGSHATLQEELVQRHVKPTPALEPEERFAAPLVGAEVVWSAKAVCAEAAHKWVCAAQCWRQVPTGASMVATLLLERIVQPAMSALDPVEGVHELLEWVCGTPATRPELELFRRHFAGAAPAADSVELLGAALRAAPALKACVREVQQTLWQQVWEGGSYEESIDALIEAVLDP